MLMLKGKRKASQSGVTLVELLAAMVILSIVTTMLIMGWVNMQRASATAVRTNNARATARDAMSRISAELRGAQPTSLPTATPSATATPDPLPPLVAASPMDVTFYSSFNSVDANADGSGLAALRRTRIWLDTGTAQPAPWNPLRRTLYLQKDMNGDGTFTDPGDTSTILARNVANSTLATPEPVFEYGYRTSITEPVLWIDNADSSLDLGEVVAIRVRLVIDRNMGSTPNYIDLTTTVRLRNASGE